MQNKETSYSYLIQILTLAKLYKAEEYISVCEKRTKYNCDYRNYFKYWGRFILLKCLHSRLHLLAEIIRKKSWCLL